MSNYVEDMMWIACFVAPENLNKYSKETVRDMIERTSSETVYDFFETYQRIFHIDMREQLGYVIDVEQEMIA